MDIGLAVRNRLKGGSLVAVPRNIRGGLPYTRGRIAPAGGIYPDTEYEPTWDSNRAVLEGLQVSSILATCISRICERAASRPWYWWRTTKSGRDERTEPVDFIEYPRRDGRKSRFQMMEEAHLHSFVAGNALFGIIWEGGSKYKLKPMELEVENPHGCAPVPDRLNWISRYRWDDVRGASRNFWDAADICHVIGRANPANPYWGWSILEALAFTIDSDVEARRLNLRRFRRSGAPATIVTDTNVRDEEHRRNLEDDLNSQAEKYFGGYMVLAGSQSITSMEQLPADGLRLIESMAAHRDEIIVACDLHPAMFSSDAATFANLETARKLEWQVAVLRNARFADAFSCKFIKPNDRATMYIAPDYSDVEELNSMDKQINRVKDLVGSCRVALNDAIAATGLTVPFQIGGDVPLVAGGLVPVTSALNPLDEE